MFLEEFHGLQAIARFRNVDHVGLAVNDRTETDADHEVILRNHGANFQMGTSTRSSVPAPGLLSSVSRPPILSARSLMPIRP